MKKTLAILLSAVMMLGLLAGCGSKTTEQPSTSGTENTETAALNVGVFYYDYSDVYISSVRSSMDEQLKAMGVNYTNYDGAGNQAQQTDQINTAISNGANLLIVNIVETSSPDAAQNAVEAAKTAGIPIIFFNREVSDDVVNSYEKCAFVGTNAPEAGHMQGQMVGEYLLENYDTVDLNGDGVISYVMFKGQEGNAEAEARTQFGVEDANAVLTAAGKPELAYYNASATDKYLVDQGGKWSAQAANDYMATILPEYSEANGNMVELIICNNDGMAEGAVSALQGAGYNTGDGKTIPVFGVDATDSAKQLINEGKMTGTIKQDAEGMAVAIASVVKAAGEGTAMADAIAATAGTNAEMYSIADGIANKLFVAYAAYTK